ncbi:hypothetical protein OYT1_ch2287 [Ferriphaselus amnicola]|uniref:Uncharacterized protein n=1 Tax=Ferriphaselus amnicola TaxID=1188319 RepID=A0A2Z6GDV0_9PROT|nr:hypothetical protein [Ferriphaselus amnicola]BBE51803.1 hypothetical protein OYT1_ch2287 [Ferriphaselus amnicola]
MKPKTRKGYTRLQLIELSQKLPNFPGTLDDFTLADVLMELLEAEQLNIGKQSAAVLLGLVKKLTDRAITNAPKPAQVNGDGEPVYTVAEIAAITGETPEAVRSGIEAIRQEGGGAAVNALMADPNQVSSLH